MTRHGSTNSRQIHLTGDRGSLDLKTGNAAGDEAIVATAQVPQTQVWGVPTGQPLAVAVVGKQTFTVDEGTANQVIDLNPDAPKVDFMPDFAAGNYSPEAYIAGYFDSDGDGSPDTLIDGASTVQYNGALTESGDFIDSFEVDDVSGNAGTKDVAFYYVVRRGYAYLQKRSSGKSKVAQELQREDSIRWAFSNPDAPDADRQVSWERDVSGLTGVIPPKFYFDVVYYDDTTDLIPLAEENATNVYIDVPLTQRPLGDDEDPKALRRKVRNDMSR
jgi:hypothetical protein